MFSTATVAAAVGLALKPNLNPNPNPNPSTFHLPRHRSRRPRSPYLLRCSAVPSFLSGSPSTASAARLHRLASEFRSLPEPIDRVKLLLSYAAGLHPFPDADRVPSNRVSGCTAQVWLSARIDAVGRMRFAADSDSEITRGFCACLLAVVDGEPPGEVLAMRADDLADLNVVGSAARPARSRVNTWQNVLVSMQNRTRALVAEENGRRLPVDPFPANGGYGEGPVRISGPSIFHGVSAWDVRS